MTRSFSDVQLQNYTSDYYRIEISSKGLAFEKTLWLGCVKLKNCITIRNKLTGRIESITTCLYFLPFTSAAVGRVINQRPERTRFSVYCLVASLTTGNTGATPDSLQRDTGGSWRSPAPAFPPCCPPDCRSCT